MNKYSEKPVSYVSIAIYTKDETGWGVGIDMYHKVKQPDGSTQYNVYHIFSIYLLRSEFETKRQIVHYISSLVLPNVPDEDEVVVMMSTLPHFQKHKELRRNASIYAPGKDIRFIQVKEVKRSSVWLAKDSVKRRSTVKECLR
jgi:hypothetical protein